MYDRCLLLLLLLDYHCGSLCLCLGGVRGCRVALIRGLLPWRVCCRLGLRLGLVAIGGSWLGLRWVGGRGSLLGLVGGRSWGRGTGCTCREEQYSFEQLKEQHKILYLHQRSDRWLGLGLGCTDLYSLEEEL